MKKTILAIVAVFVSWQALDFIIHSIILMPTYAETATLWRPEGEMMMGLMMVVSLVSAACFVLVYDWFFKEKNMMVGLKYGVVFGIGAGISMGYGTYSVQPIMYFTALGWFLGTLVEAAVAGLITGLIIKD
ncbi:MAG: hypothetical protein H6696_16540 [Deferribacteres bacterium]|nr:hypothetical protein [candidate division KSB1 bacterium]MCB9503542.1 hypothetical protein [Deferribacteres bacterium]